jgi:Na+/H+ antiporter NhaD/arsenite permease-like protein
MKVLFRRTLPLLIAIPLLSSLACADNEARVQSVNPALITPFVALLLAIAIVPFVNRSWWEKNYPFVAIGLGLITCAYYLFSLHNPARLLHAAIEYISFIALIGSLYVVAGGIHIRIRGKSTPLANVVLLTIGAVVSNLIGTTGASMILIRPYLRVNRYRIRPYHVVFFIFLVSNIGGALTPIGDPPLFLGYLRGIPFFWVAEAVWMHWAIVSGGVLAVFYLIDRRDFQRLTPAQLHAAEALHEKGQVVGLQNTFFLLVILIAVFITNPPFVRELLMIVAAAGSYLTTRPAIHRRNDFTFDPIKEVAILFVGIFATMIPALDWLEANAAQTGIRTAGQFFWATGSLSAFLDNAPTYLNFLSAAIGTQVDPEHVRQVELLIRTHGADVGQLVGVHAGEIRNTFAVLMRYHPDLVALGSVPVEDINTAYLIANVREYLQAISVGAVFFGACTYIGNGPNFMVKSIAEQSGVRCPSFFGYIFRYTLPILLPLFVVVWALFFRG